MKTPGRKRYEALEATLEELRAELDVHRTALANSIWKREERDEARSRLREEVATLRGELADHADTVAEHARVVTSFEDQFVGLKRARRDQEGTQRVIEQYAAECRQAAAVAAITQERLDRLDVAVREVLAARDVVLQVSTDSRLVNLLAERDG